MGSGSWSELCLHGKRHRRSRVIDFGGQFLEGSMVGRTELHERHANPGGEVRPGSVELWCEELSDG